MRAITVKEIADHTKGRILMGVPDAKASGVSTDTRGIKAGDAFFALSGEHFDAHDFLTEAIESGAAALVVSRDTESVPALADYTGAAILVPDVLTAYQDLAAWYRRMIAPAVIAITGSVGKTTQKDMIAAAASGTFRTVATEGNLNNHIGVPMTIFRMEEDTELLVLELGMNHAGEIRRLAEIARPDIAIITNIGISHRENFDTDDGIRNAKLEIAEFFGAENALFVNGDDPALRAYAERSGLPYPVVTAGESEGCDFRITAPQYTDAEEISFAMQSERKSIVRFTIPAAGLYNGVSAACTAAALSRIGIPEAQTASALKDLKRTDHRLRLIKLGAGVNLIDDTYNASPDSMRSAIDYLASFTDARKIAVLAGMNELGTQSESLHEGVGKYAADAGADILVAIGEKGAGIATGFAAAAAKSAKTKQYGNNAEAISALQKIIKDGDAVLVKGSRAMKTEEIIEALKEWQSGNAEARKANKT